MHCRPRKIQEEVFPKAWVSMAMAVGQTPSEKLEENQSLPVWPVQVQEAHEQ